MRTKIFIPLFLLLGLIASNSYAQSWPGGWTNRINFNILKVDTLEERTSGQGIYVTHSIEFAAAVTFSGTVSSGSLTLTDSDTDTLSFDPSALNVIHHRDGAVDLFIADSSGDASFGNIAGSRYGGLTVKSKGYRNYEDIGLNAPSGIAFEALGNNRTMGAVGLADDDSSLVLSGWDGSAWQQYLNISMNVGSVGFVGLGDTSPDYPFEILSTTTPQFAISNDDGNDYATFDVSTAGLLTITTVDQAAALGHIALMPDGNVGIGTTTPQHILSSYASNPVWALTDTDVNTNVSSAAQVIDTSAVAIDVSGEPIIKLAGSAGGDASLGVTSGGDFNFAVASAGTQWVMGTNSFRPNGDGTDDLGTANRDIRDIYTEDIFVSGKTTQETYVVRKHVALSGATDATATNFFTITTTDETGSADGGAYSVVVHLMAGEATAASGAVNTASVSLVANFTRIMASAGTGANSAVVEASESASADEGTGAIASVTLTVVETSEFVQTIQLNVDTSGGTFDGFALVELVYSDFTTPPVIAGI